MSLYKNLFTYKRKRLYDVAKEKQDVRLNGPGNYQTKGLLANMLSRHIQRNKVVSEFIQFLDDYLLNILNANRFLRSYKNYTVKKDNKLTR